jgi:hypothetical protein
MASQFVLRDLDSAGCQTARCCSTVRGMAFAATNPMTTRCLTAEVAMSATAQPAGELEWSSPLVAPEVFKARRRQLCVNDGMLDRNVAQPVLYRPGIVAVIGELVAAAVPQHVTMHG